VSKKSIAAQTEAKLTLLPHPFLTLTERTLKMEPMKDSAMSLETSRSSMIGITPWFITKWLGSSGSSLKILSILLQVRTMVGSSQPG